ncbi:hypothetical protein ACOMHN_044301 [Nucella lapillus]
MTCCEGAALCTAACISDRRHLLCVRPQVTTGPRVYWHGDCSSDSPEHGFCSLPFAFFSLCQIVLRDAPSS